MPFNIIIIIIFYLFIFFSEFLSKKTNERTVMGVVEEAQSSGQQTDRSSGGDIQRILQNEQYRKPFQVLFFKG